MTTTVFHLTALDQLPQLADSKITRLILSTKSGLTPSYGFTKEVNLYCHEHQLSSFVVINPREDDFVYNDLELRAMEEDILKAVELEADSLVIGALTSENTIDVDAIEALLPATQGLPLIFPVAFLSLPDHEKDTARQQLLDLGYTDYISQITDNQITLSSLV